MTSLLISWWLPRPPIVSLWVCVLVSPHFFPVPTSSSFLNLLTRFYPNREALTAKVEKRRVAVSDSTSLFDMLDQKQIRQVMPYLCCQLLLLLCAKKEWKKNWVGKSTKKSHSIATHCLKITQNVAFEFWHFPRIFFLLKLNFLVSLFDRMLQVFKYSP